MGTRADTIDPLIDTLNSLPLQARRVFGDYALYLDGRVVALRMVATQTPAPKLRKPKA